MKKVNQFKTNSSMPIIEEKTRPIRQNPTPQYRVSEQQAKLSIWQLVKSHEKIAIGFLIIGICLGLIYGWVINPVEWTGMTYIHLSPEDKGLLLQLASDTAAYDPNNSNVMQLRQRWPELDDLACFVVNNQPMAEDEKIRLVSLAYKINQRGCP
jgi:hypothetical protein